jgi:MarR family transcriptional regulator, organic hydroperoxide resistance regulator
MRRPADLLHLLTRAERLLARRLTAILDAEGQSLDAWRVITLLADGDGHFMTELSERAFLPPGSLTRLVDHLVEDNLLYRRVDEVDRRRIRAYLTARGHRLYERINEGVQVGLADVPFADGDATDLAQLLGGLSEALSGTAKQVPASP